MAATANLVLDSQLARGAYTSTNKNDTAIIADSRPIEVDLRGYTLPTTFGAQLYKNADGTYTAAFRGTEGSFKDWANDPAFGACVRRIRQAA